MPLPRSPSALLPSGLHEAHPPFWSPNTHLIPLLFCAFSMLVFTNQMVTFEVPPARKTVQSLWQGLQCWTESLNRPPRNKEADHSFLPPVFLGLILCFKTALLRVELEFCFVFCLFNLKECSMGPTQTPTCLDYFCSLGL